VVIHTVSLAKNEFATMWTEVPRFIVYFGTVRSMFFARVGELNDLRHFVIKSGF
jgi:uncharacterized membrane protein YhfC